MTFDERLLYQVFKGINEYLINKKKKMEMDDDLLLIASPVTSNCHNNSVFETNSLTNETLITFAPEYPVPSVARM